MTISRTQEGMTFTPAHKPGGTPDGGQFTAAAHAEPDLTLTGGPAESKSPAARVFDAVEGFASFVEDNHQRDMAELQEIRWSDLVPKFLRRKKP